MLHLTFYDPTLQNGHTPKSIAFNQEPTNYLSVTEHLRGSGLKWLKR